MGQNFIASSLGPSYVGCGFPIAWQTSVMLPPSMMGEVDGYLTISGRS